METAEPSGQRPEQQSRRSAAKGAAILRAALDAFLENGFARTSVDAIAARAGVGKQTVYSHFGDKEQLFTAVLREARSLNPAPDPISSLDPLTPRAILESAARQVIETVLDPVVAGLHRLTIAELPHHTEPQDLWRESSAADAPYQDIAEYLLACELAGSLRVVDPERSARQFVFLLATEARTATTQGTRELPADEGERIVVETVDLIIRAHRLDRPTQPTERA